MSALKSEGLEYAVLGVDSENPTGALKLYESLEFEVVRRHINFAKTVTAVSDHRGQSQK